MRRRGFMMTDAIGGLLLLATLATLLAIAIGVQSRSSARLLEQRRANAAAQEALANLQAGGEAKVADDAASVEVQRSGKFVGRSEWVEVKVARAGRHASIVGLAPTTQSAVTP